MVAVAGVIVGAAFLAFLVWVSTWDWGEARRDADCESYTFDAAAWRSDGENGRFDGPEEQAEGLADCGVLTGLTRGRVREMLGRPGSPRAPRGARGWRYPAGWVNEGLGPGDGQELVVRFDSRGRVSRATTLY